MARKTPSEKLKTKLLKIVGGKVVDSKRKVKASDKLLFSYSDAVVKYSNNRYYPTKVDPFVKEEFKVSIPLNDTNLKYISASNTNPPKFTNSLIRLFRDSGHVVNEIILGAAKNELNNKKLYIKSDLYDDFVKINSEEGKDKVVRFRNRVNPFLAKKFSIPVTDTETERDYGLLLKEVIASGQVTQKDIVSLTANLESGDSTNVVIEKQVNKQVEWLIETVEKILEYDSISKNKAKELGKKYFGFSKLSISGSEHLMEKILAKYGQFTLFGVPALLNTDKYVMHSGELSRSQFDLILITHLGDVEVVELKRPDQTVLDYDSRRNKFYPSKDLSIAIAQAERYISSVMKDNDEDFKINGKKIRDFLQEEVGDSLFIETVRPSALIIIGSHKTISVAYKDLEVSVKNKVTRNKYNTNSERAYRELRSSFKHINILTYSELLEHARTRLQIMKVK